LKAEREAAEREQEEEEQDREAEARRREEDALAATLGSVTTKAEPDLATRARTAVAGASEAVRAEVEAVVISERGTRCQAPPPNSCSWIRGLRAE
jgi:hypothetical protein